MNLSNLTEDEQIAIARVEHFVAEYSAAAASLTKGGTSLRDYVATALLDVEAEPMSATLEGALQKLQAQFGEPMNASNPMGFGVGSGERLGELPGTKAPARAFGHTY